MINSKKKREIDITPPSSIYEIFKNLTYKPESALAEFIDNSTQSFKNSRNQSGDIQRMQKIFIIFDMNKDNPTVKILDNCFGIEDNNIERVLRLNIKSDFVENSRNEYGMGLKTAAFWFANTLTIYSKHYNEKWTTYLEMSLDSLNRNIEVKYEDSNYFKNNFVFDSGTIIMLSKLNFDKILNDKGILKLGKLFSSKYRKDIEDGLKLHLIKVNDRKDFINKFQYVGNDEFISIPTIYDALPIEFYKHKFKIDQNTGNEIKIEINDSFEFNNKKYCVSGAIGILDKGSRKIAGLTLFRRGRSIIGDEDGKKYKPEKIFKDGAAFEYQRIYGFLNVDDFEVTQFKDGFKWDNGLEDEFVNFLYEKIIDNKENLNLIKLSKLTKEREASINIETDILNENAVNDISDSINQDGAFANCDIVLNKKGNEMQFNICSKDGAELQLFLEFIMSGQKNYQWLQISKISEGKFKLNLDIGCTFFSPFNNDAENVKEQMIKFCVYFAYSEIKHSAVCNESSHQRRILNDLFIGNNKEIKE